MQIFVINVRGMSLTLNVDPFDYVEDVKEQIQVKRDSLNIVILLGRNP